MSPGKHCDTMQKYSNLLDFFTFWHLKPRFQWKRVTLFRTQKPIGSSWKSGFQDDGQCSRWPPFFYPFKPIIAIKFSIFMIWTWTLCHIIRFWLCSFCLYHFRSWGAWRGQALTSDLWLEYNQTRTQIWSLIVETPFFSNAETVYSQTDKKTSLKVDLSTRPFLFEPENVAQHEWTNLVSKT